MKSNCFHISYKLLAFFVSYHEELMEINKKTYEYVISCFYKLSQTVL